MPLFGGLLRNLIRNKVETVLQDVAVQAIQQHDKQDSAGNYVSPTTPMDTAQVIAANATPMVVEELKANPSIRKAINGEPIWQSQFFYLGVTTVIGGVTSVVAQLQSGHIDVAALGGSIIAIVTGVGMIMRRAALQT